LVWGTYIHGVFDRPEFRRAWLNRVRGRKNLQPLDVETSLAVSARLVNALDLWADHVGTYINMKPVFSAIKLPKENVS
jgi:adenosylcobyric acid synthase